MVPPEMLALTCVAVGALVFDKKIAKSLWNNSKKAIGLTLNDDRYPLVCSVLTGCSFGVILMPPKQYMHYQTPLAVGLKCLKCQPGCPVWSSSQPFPVVTYGFIAALLFNNKKVRSSDVVIVTILGCSEVNMYRKMRCLNNDYHNIQDYRGSTCLAIACVAGLNILNIVWKLNKISGLRSERVKPISENIEIVPVSVETGTIPLAAMVVYPEAYPSVRDIILPSAPTIDRPAPMETKSQLQTIVTNLRNRSTEASTQVVELATISQRLTEMAAFIAQQNNKHLAVPELSAFVEEFQIIQSQLDISVIETDRHLAKYQEIEAATHTILAFLQSRKQ